MTKGDTPGLIRFQSFNPYEARAPGLRVVARETLHLVKLLREQGYIVKVEPEDGTKLNYLAEKGIKEVLSDPLFLLVVGIPISILTNIIAAWLYDTCKDNPERDDVQVVIEYDEQGRRVRYSHHGQALSNERFEALLGMLDARAEAYARSLTVVPPVASKPVPVHLEHTGKIVGWAKEPFIDDKGLRLNSITITDDETFVRIQKGELKGLSIGGIVRSSICSICSREYVDCNHIAGRHYNLAECMVRIEEIVLAEFSIVKVPVQPLATLEIRRSTK
jgi:hypothetical protein